jgi:anaerobic magnesium-protoporphyrin IX monomethyl ester cyclase
MALPSSKAVRTPSRHTRNPRDRPLLLANSYYLRYDEKQTRKMKPYAPLGTLITAALARQRGFEVELFDAMLAPGVEAFEETLDRVRPNVVGILEDNFNFLTKMCTLRMRRAALDMIGAARSRGCRVVANGSDAVDRPELYLDAGADAVIVGEAESAFLDVVRKWNADPGASLHEVPGLALAHGGNGSVSAADVRRTALRPRLEDLDALPFPAWDLVDVEEYRRAWIGAHGRLSWGMVTSRGCPYACNWCAKPVFGRRYSQRGPANVAEELRLLRERVAPDHVWFADDIFGLTPHWISEFAREVTRRDARTPFMMQSRANLMTPGSVDALQEAGAEEVWLGVESGSQRILDAMDKSMEVEQARAATRTLKSRGIRACWFIQLGYLGEERADLEATRALILAERPDEIGVSVSYPLPGTPFHEKVHSQLNGKRNWEETDSLEMLFHGTYTTGFYRLVRDALHAEVDGYRVGEGPLDGRWDELWEEEAGHRNPAALGA